MNRRQPKKNARRAACLGMARVFGTEAVGTTERQCELIRMLSVDLAGAEGGGAKPHTLRTVPGSAPSSQRCEAVSMSPDCGYKRDVAVERI